MMTVDTRFAWVGLIVLAAVVWTTIAPWAAAFVLAIPYAWIKFDRMRLEGHVERVLDEMYQVAIGVQEHLERDALKDLVSEWRGRYNEYDIAAMFMAQRLRDLLLRAAQPGDVLVADRARAVTGLLSTTSKFSSPDPHRMVLLAVKELELRGKANGIGQ